MGEAVAELNRLLTRFVDDSNTMNGIQHCVNQLAHDPQLILDQIKTNTDESGGTAVHKAARWNMFIIIDHLFSHLGAEEKYELLKTMDIYGNSLIHEAAKGRSTQILELVLVAPQTIDEKVQLLEMRNNKGDTPIHYAAIADQSLGTMLEGVAQETIRKLLKIQNEQGDTAVFGGIRNDSMKIVEYILEHLAAVDLLEIKSVQGNALHCAALAGHVMPCWLIESDDQLFNWMNETNDSGQTPMHCAMSQGHANVVKAMLKMAMDGGDIDRRMELLQNQDGNGNSPLHCAAVAGHTRALKQVLDIFGITDQRQLLTMSNWRKETVVQIATDARDRLDRWLQEFDN